MVNYRKSTAYIVKSLVPQGRVLSPLLLLMYYINNSLECSYISSFSNNTKISMVVSLTEDNVNQKKRYQRILICPRM